MRYQLALLLTLSSLATLRAQVPLTTLGTPYTQDFNTLAPTGTANTDLPAGWVFLETGTNANTTYAANNGSSNAGNTYSYGLNDSLDRAFGGLQSGSLVPTVGASFVNNTGSTITSVVIAYAGEQWRLGTANRATPDRIDFQYSTNATGLGAGAWVDVNELDFTGPGGAAVEARNGNLPANRAALSFTITGLNVAPGGTFWIRWSSFDASGGDDGLAVDDFSITPNGAGPVIPSLSINDVSASEGNSGTTNFVFTVSLSTPAGAGGVTFDIATANNTATAPSDFTAVTLTGQTIPAGSSTYSFTVPVLGDTADTETETFFVNVTNIAGANAGDVQGQGTIVNDDVPPVVIVPIHTIQGSGLTSPLIGSTVTTSGVVTAVRSNGFFLQTRDAEVDANPATSEGILVFTNSAPPAAAVAGNFVFVTGRVVEFTPAADPKQRSVTEIDTVTAVTLVQGSQPLPAPVAINGSNLTPGGGHDQLERYEGMRVSASSLTVVAPTDGNVSEPNATSTSNGVFYTVLTGTAVPVREAGIAFLDYPANSATACAAGAGCSLPLFDENPERIRIDSDAIAGQARVNVNTGAVLTNVEGVLHYEFRTYSLFPTAPPTVGGTQQTTTAAPTPSQNQVTIAAMNIERLFDTANDPAIGDPVLTTVAFEGRLGKLSQTIRNLLKAPDVVALEEVENLTTAQALATRINNDAVAAGQANPGYTAFLAEGNDVGGIDVGFLTKPGITSSLTQLGKDTLFTNPCDNSTELLNDRPPFRLSGSATRGGSTLNFTVFVNHLRSLIDIESEVSCGGSTTGGRVRAKRAAQANFLSQLVQTELTSNPAAKIVLVGDFNAFEVNDGYADLINAIMGTPAPATQVLTLTSDPTYPNMTNLVSLLPTAQRYSYVFDGNHQTIDHAILSAGAMSQFVGGGYVRVNADFNETLRSDFNRPERYSDHDPVFVALSAVPNVTAQMGVVRSGIVYNRAALTATSSLRITNNTGSTLGAGAEVVITGLPEGVRLTNAGSTSPSSAIYTLASPVAPGQTVIVPLAFSLNAIKAINYSVTVFAGGTVAQ